MCNGFPNFHRKRSPRGGEGFGARGSGLENDNGTALELLSWVDLGFVPHFSKMHLRAILSGPMGLSDFLARPIGLGTSPPLKADQQLCASDTLNCTRLCPTGGASLSATSRG